MKRLVATFTGHIFRLPILNLFNQSEIKKQYNRLLYKNKINLLQPAVDLYLRPDNPLLLSLEYYQLNVRYGIGKFKKELPICVIVPGYNLLREEEVYLKFLRSIENQNYTNYQVVLTDDASTDGTYEAVKKKIQEFPRLRTRTILIKNYQNIASLGNKVLMVHKHCKEGSIVFDMDADDSLIGRQVMKLINACYQSSDAWFIYSNYLHFNRNYASGLSREIPKAVFAANSYRTSSQWVTGHLRTYYRDLFVKIPLEYFT